VALRSFEYSWSGARAFVGLTRASLANVSRATTLLGERARWVAPAMPPTLADLEPAEVPCAGPELILAAAADAYGCGPDALASRRIGPDLCAARAVYVRLGGLESYTHEQLAGPLARTRSRVTQLGVGPIDLAGVRIARTLLRDPGLRRRLPRRVDAATLWANQFG